MLSRLLDMEPMLTFQRLSRSEAGLQVVSDAMIALAVPARSHMAGAAGRSAWHDEMAWLGLLSSLS